MYEFNFPAEYANKFKQSLAKRSDIFLLRLNHNAILHITDYSGVADDAVREMETTANNTNKSKNDKISGGVVSKSVSTDRSVSKSRRGLLVFDWAWFSSNESRLLARGKDSKKPPDPPQQVPKGKKPARKKGAGKTKGGVKGRPAPSRSPSRSSTDGGEGSASLAPMDSSADDVGAAPQGGPGGFLAICDYIRDNYRVCWACDDCSLSIRSRGRYATFVRSHQVCFGAWQPALTGAASDFDDCRRPQG